MLPFFDPFVPLPMQLFAGFVMLAVAGGFLYVFSQIIRGIGRNVANSQAPFVERQAKVVAKRSQVWGDHSRTSYFVTFEFGGGERTEYEVQGEESGLLVEGDAGTLVTQGTAYRSFTRAL